MIAWNSVRGTNLCSPFSVSKVTDGVPGKVIDKPALEAKLRNRLRSPEPAIGFTHKAANLSENTMYPSLFRENNDISLAEPPFSQVDGRL